MLESIARSHTLLYFCTIMENVLIQCCECRGVINIDQQFLKRNIFTHDFWWKMLQKEEKNGRKMYFIVK